MATPATRTSARARAQRPQLAPRMREPLKINLPKGWRKSDAPLGEDPDVHAVEARTPQGEEYIPTPDLVVATPPQPQVQSQAQPQLAPLTLSDVSYEDVDRLWDWARVDVAGATRYLGAMPTHSRALQDYIGSVLEQEARGTARIRSIYLNGPEGTRHVGFVSLLPITRIGTPVGVAHCYLCPAAQGSLPQLLPLILEQAAVVEPDLTIMVSTSDYAFAKLLEPHGFTLSIALTRPPASTARK